MRWCVALLFAAGCLSEHGPAGAPPVREAERDAATQSEVRVVSPAWQLAREGGPEALVRLQGMLGEGVHAQTVAALGLLEHPAFAESAAWSDAEDFWWGHYATQTDPNAARRWLFPIARHGGLVSQARLAADLAVLPAEGELPRVREALQAMGVLCARGIPFSTAGRWALTLALGGGPSLRDQAAYALGRCAEPSAELLAGVERQGLVGALSVLLEGSPSEAALAWKAFAGLGEVPPEIPGGVLAREDAPPWRVEVEAVRALAGHSDGRRVLVARLAEAGWIGEGLRVHVVLEALEGLRPRVASSPELLATLAPFEHAVARARAEAPSKGLTLVACELALLRAIEGGAGPISACGTGDPTLPPGFAEELEIEAAYHRHHHRRGSASEGEPLAVLLAFAQDGRARVAQAALSALANLDDPRIGARLREAVGVGDPGVRTAAAAAIAVRSARAGHRDPGAIPTLEALVTDRSSVALLEARILAVRALGELAAGEEDTARGDAIARTLVPLAGDPSFAIRAEAFAALAERPELRTDFLSAWTELEPVPPAHPTTAQGLRVVLEHGSFTVRFRGVWAPAAQAHFVAWAREGFFSGLSFHRVEPGFVVQGGDPRGDGYGGPGLVLPCEDTDMPFDRGTVGIASAGRGTGGSQFFVTAARQPHLDGRYTVLGRVDESEMAIVDAILPHDRIVRVEVWEEES